MLVLAIAQIVVGFLGFEDWFGTGWACGIVFVCVFFKTLSPIPIASFFGAMNVLEWHWAVALLFAMPGLIFIVPGAIALMLGAFKKHSA